MQDVAIKQYNDKKKRERKINAETQILNACGVVQKLIRQLKINDHDRRKISNTPISVRNILDT